MIKQQVLYVIYIRLQYCCSLLVFCNLKVYLMLPFTQLSLLLSNLLAQNVNHERNCKSSKSPK